jgi:hypothetical protein
MAIKRDFKCDQHGIFESKDGICADCGVKAERIFLGAPAFHAGRSRNIDNTLQGLANQFNMTDIKSTREGEHQAGYLKRNNRKYTREEEGMMQAHTQNAQQQQPQEQRPGSAAIWGSGFKGINMGSVLSGQAAQSIKGESVGVSPSQAGITRGPTVDPKATMRDHENLSIKN